MNRKTTAFTLIELLTAVAILAILIGMVFMIAPRMMQNGHKAASLNNLRQLGMAFQSYAADNEFNLPRRVESGQDKWPRLLVDYLGGNREVFADPEDPDNYIRTNQDPLNNRRNQTSYFMNGFNDVGAFSDDSIQVRINTIDQPSQTILMAPNSGSGHYYMDFAEGNNEQILNKRLYGKGSVYLFADGSSRYIEEDSYDDDMWLVHKDTEGL